MKQLQNFVFLEAKVANEILKFDILFFNFINKLVIFEKFNVNSAKGVKSVFVNGRNITRTEFLEQKKIYFKKRNKTQV